MHICNTCNLQFITARGLRSHSVVHNSERRIPPHAIRCSCVITRYELTVSSLISYQDNLKKCKQCGKHIAPNLLNEFCSTSCAGTFNNAVRRDSGSTRSTASRNKTKVANRAAYVKKIKSLSKSELLAKSTNSLNHIKTYPELLFLFDIYPELSEVKSKTITNNRTSKRIHPTSRVFETIKNASGVFTEVVPNSCNHCNSIFYLRQRRKYCAKCNDQYTYARDKYRFGFNVYDYPALFDLDQLTKIGFYIRHPKPHEKAMNVYRLTRDHKVSVNDAVKHNYDPYYITHPMNCELITWIDNNKKKTNSSITFAELVTLVDTYDEVNER